MYRPPNIQKPSRERLRGIARDLGYDLEEESLEQYQGTFVYGPYWNDLKLNELIYKTNLRSHRHALYPVDLKKFVLQFWPQRYWQEWSRKKSRS